RHLVGSGADGERGGRFVDDKARNDVAAAGLHGGHLKIGADDSVWVDDVFEKIADAIPTRAGEFRSEPDALVADAMALRAKLLEMSPPGFSIIGPKRRFVENLLQSSYLLLFFSGTLVDPAPRRRDPSVHFRVLQLCKLADVECGQLIAFEPARRDGVQQRQRETRAAGQRMQ